MLGLTIGAFRSAMNSSSSYVTISDEGQSLQVNKKRLFKSPESTADQNAAVRRALFQALSSDVSVSGDFLKDLEKSILGESVVHSPLSGREIQQHIKEHDAINASVKAYNGLFSVRYDSAAPVSGYESLVKRAGYAVTSAFNGTGFDKLLKLSKVNLSSADEAQLKQLFDTAGQSLATAYGIRGNALKSEESRSLINAAVDSLFDLEGKIRKLVNRGSLELTAGLSLLLDYCAARASEIMTVRAELQEADDALDVAGSLHDLVAAKSVELHGNDEFVRKTEAKVADLESRLSELKTQVEADDENPVSVQLLDSLTAEFSALRSTLKRGEDSASENSLSTMLLANVERDIRYLSEIRHIDVGRQARSLIRDLIPATPDFVDIRNALADAVSGKNGVDIQRLDAIVNDLKELIDNSAGKDVLSRKRYNQFVSRMNSLLNRFRAPGGGNYPVSPKLLQRLLGGEIGLGSVIGAYAHGFSSDDVDETIDDAFLVSSMPLGEGSVNEVCEVKYRLPDGTERTRVFKPEESGRDGLNHQAVGTTGYAPQNRIGEINIAARRCAEALGSPETMVRVTVGVHDGKIGFFMDKADGLSAEDAGNPNNANSPFSARTCAKLSPEDRVKRVGTLARELCKLEWLDWLTGQLDRHYTNYMVRWNADSGEAELKGIDNDTSFMDYRIGLTRFVLNSDRLKMLKYAMNSPRMSTADLERKLGRGSITDINGNLVLDLSRVKGEVFYEAIGRVFGAQSIARPRQIPRAVANWLRTVREQGNHLETARSLMKGSFSDVQVMATALRLKEMAEYAAELENDGAVMDDADWVDAGKLRDIVVTQPHRGNLNPRMSILGGGEYWNPRQNYLFRDFKETAKLVL